MDAALLSRIAWRKKLAVAAICGALTPACVHPTCADDHAPGCWTPPAPSDGGGDGEGGSEAAGDGSGEDASDGASEASDTADAEADASGAPDDGAAQRPED
jgi:hypothetical protein